MATVVRPYHTFTTDKRIQAHFIEKNTGGSLIHHHNCFEIEFFVECLATVHAVNGNEHEVRRGSFVVLSEADTHSYTITDKENGYYVAYSVQFQSDAIDEATEVVLRSLTGNQIECHNEEEIEQFVSLFDLLISELNNESDDFNHVSRTILKIIILMAQRLKPCSMTLNKRNAVSSEISYINRHFKENITLKQVSEYTGYSSVYFSKLFKVRYGMTFSEYLCNRRLNYARDVLLATNYSATEVAEMCGFNTITHFSKAFKRKFGISPRTFRNNRNA